MNALKKYLNWHYITINSFLRGETDGLTEEEIVESNVLSSEIDDYFTKNQVLCDSSFIVYRGISKRTNEHYEKFIGPQKAYLSTSIDELFVLSSYTNNGGYLLVLDVQPGVPYIMINDVMSETNEYYSDEYEILFPRNVILTPYKIIDKSDKENHYKWFKVSIIYCKVTI